MTEIIRPKLDFSDLRSYILLEGKIHRSDSGSYSYPDLLVLMDRTDFSHTHKQTQEIIQKEDFFMLPLRPFIDFLLLVRTGNLLDGTGSRLNSYLIQKLQDDMFVKQSSWRAECSWRGEWINAQFNEHEITYPRIINNRLENITEPLDVYCLMEDCYIYLSSCNKQGLPTRRKGSDTYYMYPRNGAVARFGASSDGVNLNCNGDPQYSSCALGVRRAKIRDKF